ncbi:hypothetical protein BGZ70_002209 [Mortierella alpina]|uniref:Crinkler effector protein N-terminal domain-containing protein n=1 Tax=Mortierella alpina TaxID=64518 RepID=A0A9P6IUX4_MORAP|nr:hypothetical protein BGZ70_002209 [Mortierella alpina]
MTDILSLFCLVDRDAVSNAFPIDIPSSQTVGHLKKLIKTEMSPDFDDITAEKLTLWQVAIPTTKNDEEGSISLETISEKSKLLPTERLFKLFVESPVNTVHILIQRPPSVSSSARLTVVVQTYANSKFLWTTDANTATLQRLRASIDSAFPGRVDGTETITIYHSIPEDIEQAREPVGSDDQLRQILWLNIRAGVQKLVVDLETQLRSVKTYTISSVNNLYELTSSRQPILSDLPAFAPIGCTPLVSGKRKRALEQLSDELEVRKRARHDLWDSRGFRNFTFSFLVRAVALFEDELLLDEKTLIQGPRGQGLIDYTISSKHDPSHMVAVTHIKANQGIEDGVAQNM